MTLKSSLQKSLDGSSKVTLDDAIFPWEMSEPISLHPGLDLTNGGTFTRSTEASYLTSVATDGTIAFLRWANPNERRIENRGDGFGSMLLVEGSRINSLKQSRDYTNTTAWAASNTVGTITQSVNSGPSPDGVMSGVWILASASANSRAQALLGQVTNPHVVTIYGRNVSGSSPDWRPNYSGSATWSGSLTSTWVRKEKIVNGNGSNLYPVDTSLGGGAVSVLVDLAQVESGYFPSSVIRTTTTAVTRSADTLFYTQEQYPATFLTKGFILTFAPDATDSEIVSTGANFCPIWFGTSTATGIFIGANGKISVWDNNGQKIISSTITFSRGQLLTITVSPINGTLTVAGATTGNGTYVGTPFTWGTTGTTMYVGSRNNGTDPCFGRFGTTIIGL